MIKRRRAAGLIIHKIKHCNYCQTEMNVPDNVSILTFLYKSKNYLVKLSGRVISKLDNPPRKFHELDMNDLKIMRDNQQYHTYC